MYVVYGFYFISVLIKKVVFRLREEEERYSVAVMLTCVKLKMTGLAVNMCYNDRIDLQKH